MGRLDQMDRVIDCPVCGRSAAMAAYTDNVRESGTCGSCGSFNRQRQLALVALSVAARIVGTEHPSLASLIADPAAAALRVHSTETAGAVHAVLGGLAGYTFSEYFGPDVDPGAFVGGVRHEDLVHTSFADASLDVLLSADVLEHIPDPYLAHREIHRILRPGGAHVFTVPSNPYRPHDEQWAAMVDGAIRWFAPPAYHGGRGGDVAVFTIFGAEMLTHLRALGFDADLVVVDAPGRGAEGDGALVYRATRVSEPTGAPVPVGIREDRHPAPAPPAGERAEADRRVREALAVGDVDEALRTLVTLGERVGADDWTLSGFAECALALGDEEAAVTLWREILATSPWRGDVRARLAAQPLATLR